jgi:hypothetical protein
MAWDLVKDRDNFTHTLPILHLGVDWIHTAQILDKWWALVKTVTDV